jgi:endonuclease/exonuclease/phosphatase family metal-dependent hydrolase
MIKFKIISAILIFNFLSFSSDRRTDTTTLTIATYNAEFLFDGRAPEGRADFPWKGNTTKSEEHMKQVAEVIKKLNADILNLCEVEDLQVLEHLNKTYLQGMKYHAFLVDGNDNYTRQNVGMLTRIDPVNGLERSDERVMDAQGKRRQVSKNYFGKFRINGHDFLIIAGHFISRMGKSDAYRNAQAKVIRNIARQGYPKSYIVILGDFNEYDRTVPDRNRNQASSKAVDILKDINPRQRGDELLSVAGLIPEPERYSDWVDWNNNTVVDSTELSLLDYILISKTLSKQINKAGILSRGYDPGKASDHYPVWVKLRMGK